MLLIIKRLHGTRRRENVFFGTNIVIFFQNLSIWMRSISVRLAQEKAVFERIARIDEELGPASDMG